MDRRTVLIFLLIIFEALINISGALALPQYLDAYNTTFNTYASCSVCHVYYEGGGLRNSYGQLFENQINHATDPSAALQVLGPAPSTTPGAPTTPTPITIAITSAPTVTATSSPAYDPFYEDSIVTSRVSGSPNWWLKNNFRRKILDKETFSIIYNSNGGKYWIFSDSDINKIPQGPDITLAPTPTPPPTSTATPIATAIAITPAPTTPAPLSSYFYGILIAAIVLISIAVFWYTRAKPAPKLQPPKCPTCSTEALEGDSYCRECGRKL